MKKFIFSLSLFLVVISIHAQTTANSKVINDEQAWLKLGLNMALTVGQMSDYNSFALGFDVSGQFLRTNHFALGVVTGYTQYFKKSKEREGGYDFGSIPLGLMLRFYPKSIGFFVGADIGYTFLTTEIEDDGGFYVRPQVGYQNNDWNIFAFYNQVFTPEPWVNIQAIGLSATYNIRFK